VRQPLAEMGSAAAQMLGELIEGVPLRSNRVELSTELIVRESTAALGPHTVIPEQRENGK
jgi:LacI family transcriptional regulator